MKSTRQLAKDLSLYLQQRTDPAHLYENSGASFSDPPTDAELDAAFDTPANLPSPSCFWVEGSLAEYLCITDGTYWHVLHAPRADAGHATTTVWLDTPLTSTSYDGDDSYSSGNNSVDLVTDFGLPENVTAVYLRFSLNSATAGAYANFSRASGVTASISLKVSAASSLWYGQGWVKVHTDGTINMYLSATTTVRIEISGYMIPN